MIKLLHAFIVGLFLCGLLSCEQQQKQQQKAEQQANETLDNAPAGAMASAMADEETYLELRNELININPQEFGFTFLDEGAFGIVIDFPRGDSIITVATFETGDVSVYSNTGVLYMRGMEVEEFKEMGLKLLEKAQTMLLLTNPSTNQGVPPFGEVKFSFISNQGITVHQDKATAIARDLVGWKKLLAEARAIANAMEARAHSQ